MPQELYALQCHQCGQPLPFPVEVQASIRPCPHCRLGAVWFLRSDQRLILVRLTTEEFLAYLRTLSRMTIFSLPPQWRALVMPSSEYLRNCSTCEAGPGALARKDTTDV